MKTGYLFVSYLRRKKRHPQAVEHCREDKSLFRLLDFHFNCGLINLSNF